MSDLELIDWILIVLHEEEILFLLKSQRVEIIRFQNKIVRNFSESIWSVYQNWKIIELMKDLKYEMIKHTKIISIYV